MGQYYTKLINCCKPKNHISKTDDIQHDLKQHEKEQLDILSESFIPTDNELIIINKVKQSFVDINSDLELIKTNNIKTVSELLSFKKKRKGTVCISRKELPFTPSKGYVYKRAMYDSMKLSVDLCYHIYEKFGNNESDRTRNIIKSYVNNFNDTATLKINASFGISMLKSTCDTFVYSCNIVMHLPDIEIYE